MTATSAQRHLDRSALQDYLSRLAPATVVVPGDPTCRLVFYPQQREMSLRTAYVDSQLPDLAAYEHVNAQIIEVDGERWSEVTLHHGPNGHEAYLMLSDIADMLQQRSLAFTAAVVAAIDTFQDLLARTGTLSPEKQTGLYGDCSSWIRT